MKIKDLDQHCGECGIIELCGDPFDYCLCSDPRFGDMEAKDYKELAEKIDWSDYPNHPPCILCDRDCDECEENSVERDIRVRFIADKVAGMLPTQ